MLEIIIIFSGCLLLFVIYIFTSCQKQHNNIIKVPGYPIIGNLLDMLPHKLLASLERFRLIYGKLYEVYVLNKRIIITSDHYLMKELLSKRPKIFRRLRSFDHGATTFHFSNGLFHSSGNTWNHIRRITSPSFSNQNILLKVHIIMEEALNIAKQLETYVHKKETIDMKSYSFYYTLNVITKVALGSKLSKEASNYLFGIEFPKHIKEFFRFALESALFPFPLWIWHFSPYYKYELNAIPCNEMLTKYSLEIINEQRQLIYNEKIQQNNDNDINSNNNTCMITEMIRKEYALNNNNNNNNNNNDLIASDEDLLANVKTFFLAGSDTTSVTITSALYFLYTHPIIADRLRYEVDAFYIKIMKESISNKDIEEKHPIASIQDLNINDVINIQNDLKLCNAVLKEALRLGSPAPFLGIELESTSEPYTSTYDPKLKIYPKDEIFLYIEGAMKNSEIFYDPDKFIPDRWLLENIDPIQQNLMKESFLAFGYGPRVCPGMQLANIEAMLFLATIIHYYDMQLACPINEIYREISFVASFNKLPMYLTRR